MPGQADRATWGLGLAGVCFAAFAVTTLERQRRRERPVLDATLVPGRGLASLAGLALAVSAGYLGLLLIGCYLRYRALARRF